MKKSNTKHSSAYIHEVAVTKMCESNQCQAEAAIAKGYHREQKCNIVMIPEPPGTLGNAPQFTYLS
jgi:hypothetical protein